MEGRADEPARPTSPFVSSERMRLPIQRPRNGAPIDDPAVSNQARQRAVQEVARLGPPQPAAARC
eukprot:14335037-Alexandrium_andersonii.AAC.1